MDFARVLDKEVQDWRARKPIRICAANQGRTNEKARRQTTRCHLQADRSRVFRLVKNRVDFSRFLHQQEVTQSFSGPLPPPLSYASITRLSPASRIALSLRRELQTEHRIRMEAEVIDADIDNLGLVLSAVLSYRSLASCWSHLHFVRT